jgi:glycosyltransferase involved in cell wall biosynthesis
MFNKVIHVVHWQNSGIYHVVKTLSQYKDAELNHEIVVLKDKNGHTSWKQIKKLCLSLLTSSTAIHAHSFLPCLLLPFNMGKKFSTFHSDYPFLTNSDLKSKIKKNILRLILKFFTVRISCISPKIQSILNSNLSVDGCVIFNPVEVDNLKTLSTPNEIKSFGLMGRFDYEKNFESAIKAFIEANKEGKFELVIAGDGQLKDKLMGLSQLCSHNSINFIGQVSNKSDFYKKIDCLVCSSFYEGGPLVVMEAMLAKRLIISTEVGFLQSFNKLLYIKTGSNIIDLKGAINIAKDIPIEKIEDMTKNNQLFCEKHFNIDTIYNQYLNKLWLT